MNLDDDRDTAPPSTPPALFEVSAVASMAGLRDSCGHVPLDACVPTVTGVHIPPALCANAALILRQIDGEASLGALAEITGLSLADSIESFLLLLRLGVVGVREDCPLGTSNEFAA
jgi:hypothetical protein